MQVTPWIPSFSTQRNTALVRRKAALAYNALATNTDEGGGSFGKVYKG